MPLAWLGVLCPYSPPLMKVMDTTCKPQAIRCHALIDLLHCSLQMTERTAPCLQGVGLEGDEVLEAQHGGGRCDDRVDDMLGPAAWPPF